MNLAPISAANITVDSGLQSSAIQKIIDNSKSGDTLTFKGGNYNNVSLVINKKLKILASKNTVLYGNNSMGSTFVFYFTNQSSGSALSGFNINTHSSYALILNNVKNLNITGNHIYGGDNAVIKVKNGYNINVTGNTISKSGGNGLIIDSSNKILIFNNLIYNNSFAGINITKSSNIYIKQNRILNNKFTGIGVYSSKDSIILNNLIENNGFGIYLANTNNMNIIGNNITNNLLNGISLEEITQNTYISLNYIIHNLNGIYMDSVSTNDKIIANYIADSFQSINTELNVFYTGNGIKFGDNYWGTDSKKNIKYNVIIKNEHFAVMGNMNGNDISVGANFYGTNDPHDTLTCPMVSTCMLKAKLEKTSQGYVLKFYETTGNIETAISNMPIFNAVFQLNGANSKVVPVINGTAVYKSVMDQTKENIVSVILGDFVINYIENATQTNNTGNSTNNPGTGTTNGTNGNTNSTSTGGNGNTPGSGTGVNGSGTSKGNGTFTGTGQENTMIGESGTLSNKGGQDSSGDKSAGNAIEVALKNAINSIDNPFNNLGIIALLGLIGLGYFKRDKFK